MSDAAWISSANSYPLLPPQIKVRHKSTDRSADLVSSLYILSHSLELLYFHILELFYGDIYPSLHLMNTAWLQLLSGLEQGPVCPCSPLLHPLAPGSKRPWFDTVPLPVAVASSIHYTWLFWECLAEKTILALSMTFCWREVYPPSSGEIITLESDLIFSMCIVLSWVSSVNCSWAFTAPRSSIAHSLAFHHLSS